MRCANLDDTWINLTAWFDAHRILVLPPLQATGVPLARLDADAGEDRVASEPELDRVLGRLRALVECFDIRAVYVDQERDRSGRHDQQLGVVTLCVVAGGVVHELRLFAASYAAYLDRAAEAHFYPVS